ncbi:uncharacterized protein H6S33_004825 [Morchella sextelata]|uniref:uncharacterized protein n=1 Tax=Morchella sextelata TaxID=1174677 RepID=UPI001D03E92B|nr:uncharacterized protein H6S33_004825 [Morchella sextelata]KAH0605603.1 hypothetical protein H6S33_004825 [Morchella sextelata]
MAVLQDLPNEIIYQILSALYSSYNPKLDPTPRLNTFLALGRVSRRLRKNAERFIYRTVDVGYSPTSTSKHKRPWQLLRTLIARPYLAAYIRSISIRWGTEHKPKVTSHENALFTAAASKLGLELAVRWEGDQALLLCHMLKNVETLAISYPPDFGPNLTDPFGLLREYGPSVPAPGVPPLSTTGMQGIHTLTVHSESTTTAQHIIPMLLLPNLRTLTAHHVTTTAALLPENPAWHGASRVTHLRLLACELHGSTLAIMFRVASKLKHLEYDDAGGRFNPAHACDEAFAAALQIVRPTLQHLAVNLAKVQARDGTHGKVGSLKAFPLLREVVCNYGAIWGMTFATFTPGVAWRLEFAAALPAALEALEVWLPWEFTMSWLGELLKEKETRFRFLKIIRMYPMGKYGSRGKRFIKKFRRKAERVGVKVGVAKMVGDRIAGYEFS